MDDAHNAQSGLKQLKIVQIPPQCPTSATFGGETISIEVGASGLEFVMASVHAPFEKRLKKIVRTHERMSHGVTHTMRKDGLIVAKPRIYNPRFPLKGLLLLILTAFMFKGYIYATLGPADYESRVAALGEGTLIEQAGAWIMTADVVTVQVGTLMNSIGL